MPAPFHRREEWQQDRPAFSRGSPTCHEQEDDNGLFREGSADLRFRDQETSGDRRNLRTRGLPTGQVGKALDAVGQPGQQSHALRSLLTSDPGS